MNNTNQTQNMKNTNLTNKVRKTGRARFFTEVTYENGQVKFSKAKRLVDVNQYTRTWNEIDSRQLARMVNNSDIVIK